MLAATPQPYARRRGIPMTYDLLTSTNSARLPSVSNIAGEVLIVDLEVELLLERCGELHHC